MGGFQGTMVGIHGFLIVDGPTEQRMTCIIPEGEIAGQINSNRDQYKKQDAEENDLPCLFGKDLKSIRTSSLDRLFLSLV